MFVIPGPFEVFWLLASSVLLARGAVVSILKWPDTGGMLRKGVAMEAITSLV